MTILPHVLGWSRATKWTPIRVQVRVSFNVSRGLAVDLRVHVAFPPSQVLAGPALAVRRPTRWSEHQPPPRLPPAGFALRNSSPVCLRPSRADFMAGG